MIFDSHLNKTYFHKKGFEAFQLILLSGGHVDHLRVHQDHVLIFFIIFNLTLMSSVGSGSHLCAVIDLRPVTFLEHCFAVSLVLKVIVLGT